MDTRHFGTMLRKLRRAHGLTQGELAEQLGLDSHAHISNLERGRKIPSLTLVRRIARFFQIPIDRLLRSNETGSDPTSTAQRSQPLVLREVSPPYTSTMAPDTGEPH